ncbi:MAG TPA: alpha/beta hydrolase [Bdellovibrio sp.]|uniref:serine aminopeptidase domain-containing protein n=1 Tax=Bdellovibrio sp. TaxID=28201 RepID=UPI002F1F27C3
MRSIFLFLAIISSTLLVNCASTSPKKMILPAVTVAPFSVENKGYTLNGQINDVAGSDTIAILYHGSGVQDRWETMPADVTLDGKPSPTFKIISDQLNSVGISTCVFDKRAFKEKNTPAFEKALKTHTFGNIKADAEIIFNYVNNLPQYKKIVLMGHSEGTITASDVLFKNKQNSKIKSIVLIGVAAENIKTSIQHQMTDVMATNTFDAVDKNHDGKIYPDEVPEKLKSSLPINSIDHNKKGYITYEDLLKVLKKQSVQFMKSVYKAPSDTILLGKPAQWYKDIFAEKTLLQRANEYSVPVLIVHGVLDTNVFYSTNALPLSEKLRALHKDVTLISYFDYGHVLSPNKEDGEPTMGPIQPDAVSAIADWIKLH